MGEDPEQQGSRCVRAAPEARYLLEIGSLLAHSEPKYMDEFIADPEQKELILLWWENVEFYHHFRGILIKYKLFIFSFSHPSFFLIWKRFHDSVFPETHSNSAISLVV